MKILITGGCGFIGSNFINYYFPRLGVEDKLINIDAMYYCANENNIDEHIRTSSNYFLVKGNLIEMELVKRTIEDYQITHVIHFAAQSSVQDSFENSLQFTQDNILGTHILLEVCRKYGKILKFVHCSTDEVYGESKISNDEIFKTENSTMNPSSPYASSKASADLIVQSYFHSYKMPIIITRGNNAYGGRRNALQYPEKLIPIFIKLLSENKKVTIQGRGLNVRAFLHTDDTVSAFETVLNNGINGEIYNIGCDEENFKMEFTVMEVAEMLIKKMKGPETNVNDWIEYIDDRPFNDARYFISNQKIKDLGWKITVKFEDGINELLERMNLLV